MHWLHFLYGGFAVLWVGAFVWALRTGEPGDLEEDRNPGDW